MHDSDHSDFDIRLSKTLHDLTGPMLTARGFTGELRLARKAILALLDSLPPETNPEVLQNLKDQVDSEMDQCLFRIEESLAKLDTSIQGLREQ